MMEPWYIRRRKSNYGKSLRSGEYVYLEQADTATFLSINEDLEDQSVDEGMAADGDAIHFLTFVFLSLNPYSMLS
jgi:hypothetical protein